MNQRKINIFSPPPLPPSPPHDFTQNLLYWTDALGYLNGRSPLVTCAVANLILLQLQSPLLSFRSHLQPFLPCLPPSPHNFSLITYLTTYTAAGQLLPAPSLHLRDLRRNKVPVKPAVLLCIALPALVH